MCWNTYFWITSIFETLYFLKISVQVSELVNICVLLPSDFLDFTNFNKIWLSKACKKLDTHFSFIEIPVSDKKVIFFVFVTLKTMYGMILEGSADISSLVKFMFSKKATECLKNLHCRFDTYLVNVK